MVLGVMLTAVEEGVYIALVLVVIWSTFGSINSVTTTIGTVSVGILGGVYSWSFLVWFSIGLNMSVIFLYLFLSKGILKFLLAGSDIFGFLVFPPLSDSDFLALFLISLTPSLLGTGGTGGSPTLLGTGGMGGSPTPTPPPKQPSSQHPPGSAAPGDTEMGRAPSGLLLFRKWLLGG